jgi:hypothetical protein
VVWQHLSPHEAVLLLLVFNLYRENKPVGMCGRNLRVLNRGAVVQDDVCLGQSGAGDLFAIL